MKTPTTRRTMLRLLPIALWALGTSGGRAETPLEAMMRAMAQVRESRADFQEQKAMPELAMPFPSTGTLHWVAPDRLEKHTLDPVEEILRIEGDRLLLERPREGVRREISLDQSPDIRPLVEIIRAPLAGDLATLRRYYDIAFEGSLREGWRMRLTPLTERLRVAVQSVELTGQGTAIRTLDIRASEGETQMRITPAS